MPLSVTLSYIFANLDAASRLDLPEDPGSDPFKWLTSVIAAGSARGVGACLLPSNFDLFCMFGLVGYDQAKGAWVDLKQAKKLFKVLEGTDLPSIQMADALRAIQAGEVANAVHCSFFVPEMLRKTPFKWRAYPLPMAKKAMRPGYLTVFGVSRACNDPGLCAEFIRFVSSKEVQNAMAAVHGNIPVVKSALDTVAPTKGGELPRETIDRAIEYTTLCWPEADWYQVERQVTMRGDFTELLKGEMNSKELLEKFEFNTQFFTA